VPPCWRLETLFEPPRVHRALPPGPRFRHAFTRLQRARSKRLTGCSPGAAGPRAVRRFLQLCGSPSTTSDSPNPAGVFSEAEAPAPWVARIPCGPHQPDRPRSGVAHDVFLVGCRTALVAACERDQPEGGLETPASASAAPTRIYPNLITTRTPLVACWYLPNPESRCRPATARSTPA
jgi:hypothetical protein